MSLRVVYFGTYRAEYARNQILIEGLRRTGVEVVECHTALWRGVEDRVQAASGGWMNPAFWWRLMRTYVQLLINYRQIGKYDILVVGYPGHMDIFPAWLLARLRRKPLVWDVLNSLYLITTERGIQQRSRFTVELIRHMERLACRLSSPGGVRTFMVQGGDVAGSQCTGRRWAGGGARVPRESEQPLFR